MSNTAARSREDRKRARDFVHTYLERNPCAWCGESNPLVLDFDHVVHASKRSGVSDMTRGGYSLGTIGEEIAKCDVLCANCHRVKTAKERGTTGWHKYGHKYRHGPDAPASTKGKPPRPVRMRLSR